MSDWFDTPYGWLMRHYMSNGMVVGMRYESMEQRQQITRDYEALAAKMRAEG